MNPKRLEGNSSGYKMLIPACMIFLVVNTIPFVYGVGLSFTNTNYFKPATTGNFIGLKNYISIFKNEEFYVILGFTLLYTLVAVFLSYLLGMAFALLLNRDIKGRNFLRGLALMPWVMAPAVAVIIWRWMLNDQLGSINMLLVRMNLISEPIHFLSDITLARITVMLFAIWKSYPFMMVVLLGGLQSIGKDAYEPAKIDGANKMQCFYYVTLPLLKPVSLVSLSLMFIWTFNTNSFDNIYLLTRGGPVNAAYVLSIESYYAAFYRGKIGYAAAISLIMTVFIGITVLVCFLAKKAKTAREASMI